jgi:hypothetical protein
VGRGQDVAKYTYINFSVRSTYDALVGETVEAFLVLSAHVEPP